MPPTNNLLRTRRSALQPLLDPLSLAILEGGFKDGDHITAVMKGGRLVFEKTPEQVV
jgi:ATP-dependent Clp protease ATP-binding subunit ClpB